MSEPGEVVSVNVSQRKGTAKTPCGEIRIDDLGVAGDAHAGHWHRQVSLLSQESIDAFSARTGKHIGPGEFAENITVRGVSLDRASILDRFLIADAELELTQIGKKCHGEGCAIYREVGECVMPTQGVFCRVVRGGTVRPGDRVRAVPKVLRCRVITLSDRAAAGAYCDTSGPRVQALLADFFRDTRWRVAVETTLLPDDAARLRAELQGAREAGTDVLITTGGTGVGPRDIAPETAETVCDKLLPGIMEHIRVKYGSRKPNALLSRGIAGTAGTMQVYTLPGSVRAVEEYMVEILKTLEHVLFMLHGLDVH